MLITLNDCGKFLYNNINGCVKNVETFGTYLGVFRICARNPRNTAKTDEVCLNPCNISVMFHL
ncbi:hypothetical protein GCK32_022571 [Trichostrongylus colubriformis]|uniref:Uncharacterized protein n=1 Tax=Trichostrongylus colubriformis TaxID=6319 RepID=A0AAN8F7E2_TRICO